jgi:hypothetical protein
MASPTAPQLAELEVLVGHYGSACADLQAFFVDLQIAMQNELLGHLFEGRSVPPRVPLEPRGEVLLRDPDEGGSRPPGRLV